MKKIFIKAVNEAFERTKAIEKEILEEKDILHLPAIVQKYLKYVNVLGKEKVVNFYAEFRGGIRSGPNEEFMNLHSIQYNFTDNPTRLFYITAKRKGIPARGIHLYRDAKAVFKIRIAGLITVVDAKGKEMDQGETVTVFNDMCFIAPATLISKNVRWESIDPLTVKAWFTNGSITIEAILYFNDKGELINFSSNDRFETTDGKTYKNYPWLTPATGYKEINGYRLASGARLIYKKPDGDFCYGEFELVDIRYNTEFR